MTVEIYRGQKFKFGHERRAYGYFLQDMIDKYSDSEELYTVISEFEANTASIDTLVITNQCLIRIDFKELTQVQVDDPPEIVKIKGKENGLWQYTINDETYRLGGFSKNPYNQSEEHFYQLAEWLEDHSADLPRGPWNSREARKYLYSWVVISPGFKNDFSDIDIPWDKRPWFKILPLPSSAWEIRNTTGTSSGDLLHLDQEHMNTIVSDLGVQKLSEQDLREILPRYRPPKTKSSLFRIPFRGKGAEFRDVEKQQLLESLDDGIVTIFYLGGPYGIGKSLLAGWFADQAKSRNYNILWAEGKEDITFSNFLSAIDIELNQPQLSTIIGNHQNKLREKLGENKNDADDTGFDEIKAELIDAVVHYLNKDHTLIVIDDFHKINQPEGFEEFFTNIIRRSDHIKIFLTARERPDILDSPDWSFSNLLEIPLQGLPLKDVSIFFAQIFKEDDIDPEDIRTIWKRTGGNPKILYIFARIAKRRGIKASLIKLPDFGKNNEDMQEWFDEFTSILTKEEFAFASALSVVRNEFDREVAQKLGYKYGHPEDFLDSLMDKYVINSLSYNEYEIFEPIKDYLYSKLEEKSKQRFHFTVGNHFFKKAEDSDVKENRLIYFLESTHHFENTEDENKALESYEQVYQLSDWIGDLEHEAEFAKKGWNLSKRNNDRMLQTRWLFRVIDSEIKLNNVTEAAEYMNEVESRLPGSEDLVSMNGDDSKHWNELITNYWIHKGRIADRKKESQEGKKFLEKGILLAKSLNDNKLLSECNYTAGRIVRRYGEYDLARDYFSRAYELIRDDPAEWQLQLRCISHIALIDRYEGKTAKAAAGFEKAAELAQENDDYVGMQINETHLARLEMDNGNYEKASPLFEKWLDHAQKTGQTKGERILLGYLAEIKTRLNQLEVAKEFLDRYERLSKENKDHIGIGWALARRGLWEQKNKNHDKGNSLIRKGIDYLENFNYKTYSDELKSWIVTSND